MPRTIQWLEFLTEKERSRREKRAKSRLVPLGDAQQEAELALLRPLVQTRAADSDLLFQLICAKNCVTPADPEDDPAELLEEWLSSPLARRFSHAERMTFLALAKLERGVASLEQMPTAQQLSEQAELLLNDRASPF